MPTYLVTGGCGFIGSHLVDALLAADDANEVRVIDDLSTGSMSNVPERDRLTVTQGDIANFELMRAVMKGCDGVFHLAAVASVQRANEVCGSLKPNFSPLLAISVYQPRVYFLLRTGLVPTVRTSQARSLSLTAPALRLPPEDRFQSSTHRQQQCLEPTRSAHRTKTPQRSH